MCGPDQEPPAKPYTTHTSISSMLSHGEYVLEEFPVAFGGYTYKSWVAYQKDAPPRPVVLVFPNYAGLKQFDKDQAMFLAKLGYVGLAVDLYTETEGYMYGDRNPVVDCADGEKPAHGYVNMKDANMVEYWKKKFTPGWDPVKDPVTVAQTEGMSHFKKAFEKYQGCLKAKGAWRDLMLETLTLAKKHPAVHPALAAGIGYCFGGQCLLDMVRMGADLQGVCSLHGLLQSEPANLLAEEGWDGTVDMTGVEDKYNASCKVLIENAELDDHVSEEGIKKFIAEMNEHGIDWQIHHHSQTKHGWALPPGVWATEYLERSDRRSTNNMIALFREIFPDHPPQPVCCNAAGTTLDVMVDVRLLVEPEPETAFAAPLASTTTSTATTTTGTTTTTTTVTTTAAA